MNENLYFILSAQCKLVKGLKRSVIVDYGKGDLFFISHDYHKLLKKLDRNLITEIENEIDKPYRGDFNDFLKFLLESEIGFTTQFPEKFPKISDEYVDEEYFVLQDVILEIDQGYYDEELFRRVCKDLNKTNCKDFQIRLLSTFSLEFLNNVIEIINNTTQANYIEIHCTYIDNFNLELLKNFTKNHVLISKIFVYNAPEVEIIEVVNEISDHFPMSLGTVYFVNYPFDNGNCCGIINQMSMNYTSIYIHNKLKKRNGCLDKKIAIDRKGNIKNCPSMANSFGNINDTSILDVLQKKGFRKLWNINKDQISTCKVCEFRYNCTDCRAFIEYPDDIYSKPLKCGYNPSTCEWEEWSQNSLKIKVLC